MTFQFSHFKVSMSGSTSSCWELISHSLRLLKRSFHFSGIFHAILLNTGGLIAKLSARHLSFKNPETLPVYRPGPLDCGGVYGPQSGGQK